MKPLRLVTRTSTCRSLTTFTTRSLWPQTSLRARHSPVILDPSQPFSYSVGSRKGLQSETDNPSVPNTEPSVYSSNTAPAQLSEEEYHEKADAYLVRLVLALEEKAESSPDFEVEYDSGTLQLSTPQGIYVINKQRPNKQILLASPVSGPKRYDFLAPGAGQHKKEGSQVLQNGEGITGRAEDGYI